VVCDGDDSERWAPSAKQVQRSFVEVLDIGDLRVVPTLCGIAPSPTSSARADEHDSERRLLMMHSRP